MMPPLLSQLPLDSVPALVVFVVGGSAAIFLINQVLTFYKDHMREQPSPAATYATKLELTKVETDLRASLGEIETELSDSLQQLGNDLKAEAGAQAGKRKAIYHEVEQLGKDMAGLKADNVTQTRQLFNVEQKVDRILERMPRP